MFSRTRTRRSEASPETLPAALSRLRARVDARLDALIPDAAGDRLAAAQRAAVCSPGKRLRPALALLVAETFGRPRRGLDDAACAVELVHAASLALDDLPCMDDAGERRGQPTLHRRFGEAEAILASFALLARAQILLGDGLASLGIAPAYRRAVERRLADVVESMSRGQSLDLQPAPPGAGLEHLERIHAQKTGALFELAAEVGAVAVGLRADRLEAILAYARNLGLAFQVRDDLLDEQGPAGKTPGRDRALGRTTFVSVFGVGGARALLAELGAAARAALEPLGPATGLLPALAEHVGATA